MSIKDALGSRMKEQYEHRTRVLLPRRTYTLIRCDGKAFHTYTRGMDRPFDGNLLRAMETAAGALVREVQGAAFGYTQSDEISVLVTDFGTPQTCAWFDGSVQKMASVAASCVTAAFNAQMPSERPALFDARVWTIPDPTEVMNYFVWRQQDAERNSLSMMVRCHYSHGELVGKSRAEQHDLLHAKGVNWNDIRPAFKRGVALTPDGMGGGWVLREDPPIFTAPDGWEWLRRYIPMLPQ